MHTDATPKQKHLGNAQSARALGATGPLLGATGPPLGATGPLLGATGPRPGPGRGRSGWGSADSWFCLFRERAPRPGRVLK